MTSQWHDKTELMLQLVLYSKGLHGVEPAADVGSAGYFMSCGLHTTNDSLSAEMLFGVGQVVYSVLYGCLLCFLT